MKKGCVRSHAPLLIVEIETLFREDRILDYYRVEVTVSEVLVGLQYALRHYLVADGRGVAGRGEDELVAALYACAVHDMHPVPAHYALRYLHDFALHLHEMALEVLALVEYLLYGVSLGYPGLFGLLCLLDLLDLLGLYLLLGGGLYCLTCARPDLAFKEHLVECAVQGLALEVGHPYLLGEVHDSAFLHLRCGARCPEYVLALFDLYVCVAPARSGLEDSAAVVNGKGV